MSFFSFLLIISSWHFYIQEKKRHKKLKCFGLFCLIGVLCPLKIKFLILILSGFYVMPIFAAISGLDIFMNHSNSELLENHLKNYLKLLKITSITSKIIFLETFFWKI